MVGKKIPQNIAKIKKRVSGADKNQGLSIFSLANFNRIDQERREKMAQLQK